MRQLVLPHAFLQLRTFLRFGLWSCRLPPCFQLCVRHLGLHILPDVLPFIVLTLKGMLRYHRAAISRDLRPKAFAVLVFVHGLQSSKNALFALFI